jgi:hypothetical protein
MSSSAEPDHWAKRWPASARPPHRRSKTAWQNQPQGQGVLPTYVALDFEPSGPTAPSCGTDVPAGQALPQPGNKQCWDRSNPAQPNCFPVNQDYPQWLAGLRAWLG